MTTVILSKKKFLIKINSLRHSNYFYDIFTYITNKFYFKKQFAFTIGCFNILIDFIKRYLISSNYARSISSELSFYNNDFNIVNRNGVLCSKKISFISFMKGSLTNTMSALIKYNFKNNFKLDIQKYIIESQDFLTIDNKFITYKIYDDSPTILVKNNAIYINNIEFENCDDDIINICLYQILIIQQHISHLGIGHLLSVYGYLLLKKII